MGKGDSARDNGLLTRRGGGKGDGRLWRFGMTSGEWGSRHDRNTWSIAPQLGRGLRKLRLEAGIAMSPPRQGHNHTRLRTR